MARITIIGGHGKVALLLAPLLVADGHSVTSVIRNPAHADEVAATGAVPVVADVETLDVSGLQHLVQGQDVLVWSAGAGGGSPARTYAVDRDAAIRTMVAAEAAGIPRFVMVSYYGAALDHGVPQDSSFFAYAEAKAAADERLRVSGLSWTILKPSALTLEPSTGRISDGSGPNGRVSRASVAEVARAVIAAAPELVAGRDILFNDGDLPIADVIAGQAR